MTQPIQIGFKLAGNKLGASQIQLQSELAMLLGEDSPRLIKRFELDAEASLTPGEHAVSPANRAARFGVDKDTHLTASVTLADVQNKLCLEQARLDFNKPIHLKNIFTTIDELSVLVSDTSPALFKSKVEIDVDEIIAKNEFLTKAKSYVETNAKSYFNKLTDSIADTAAWKLLKDAAEKRNLKENFEKSKEKSKEFFEKSLEKAEESLDEAIEGVHLSTVEIAKAPKGENLTFFVTGEVAINEKLRHKFEHIQLPEMLLPSFDAQLSTLLGQFCVDSEQGGNLSRTILGMIEQAAGHVKAQIQIKDIPIEICTRPGRMISCLLDSQRTIELSTQIEIQQNNQNFDFNIHGNFKDIHHPPCGIRICVQASTDALIKTGKSLAEKDWQCSLLGKGTDIRGKLEFEPSFALYPNSLSLFLQDEALKMPVSLAFALGKLPIQGIVDFGIEAENKILHIHTFAINAELPIDLVSPDPIIMGNTTLGFDKLSCQTNLQAIRTSDGDIRIHVKPQAKWDIQTHTQMIPIAEFGLEDQHATIAADGTLQAELNLHVANGNDDIMAVDFNHSTLNASCHQIHIVWGRHHIDTTTPIDLKIDIHKAALSISGLMQSLFTLGWNMAQSPELTIDDRHAPLIPDELLTHQIDLNLSDCGVLQFENATGFYDHNFFNALIVPSKNLVKLLDILKYDPLWVHLYQLGEITLFHKYPLAKEIADKIDTCRTKCENLGILSIKKLVHPPHLADLLSILLFGDTRASAEILPSLERAHHADGIDRFKVEELLERAFPNVPMTHAGRILQWISKAFSITSYTEPAVTHRPALSDDPRYTHILEALPTPNHIYDGDWSDGHIAHSCKRYAAGFTPEQLTWILANHAADFDAQTLEKLKMLIDIKNRFREMQPREGTFIVQDFNIDMFIDALITREYELWDEVKSESPRDDDTRECFRTWLAPADIACLISAGIMSRDQGLFVQTNQARLFEYVIQRGRTYARAVFYETGQQSMRVLAGMLISWLAQPQNLMKTQVDRATELSKLLGIEIPHPDVFAPLGEKQTASYFEAIFNAAKAIVDTSEAYNAAILRLQSYRFETTDAPATPMTPKAVFTPPELDEPLVRKLESDLLAAIDMAERIAKDNGLCDSDAGAAYEIDAPQNIWNPALQAAKALLSAYPRAYERPVLQQFWHRMFEALRIAAIDEDITESNDDTRGWFAYKLSKTAQEIDNMTRKDRIQAIIDIMYVHPEDREQRRRDPMTWTVPRAPRTPVDLTLITAMGVITMGRSGHELESTFQRLTQRYGIRVVRSDTGMIQSLDYNADRIIEVLETIEGPFVMFGYSQGCANMMRAESRLLGGTPQQRAILDRLVSRYALSSAFNGSVHAIASFDKYRDLIIAGEHILKGLSTTVSKPFANLIIALIQRILDTPLLTTSLASVEALSHCGLQKLARDAQYKPGIVNLETQAIAIDPLPEMMVNMQCYFDKQSGMPNDAQVGINCAHIYPVFNHNEAVDILKTQTIPSQILNYHHWAMLNQEIEFLETDQDIERFAYRGPRSFYVLPWIETLILFGRVQ